MKKKKIYICPELGVASISGCHLMAASGDIPYIDAKRNDFAEWEDNGNDTWGNAWASDKWEQVGNNYELPKTRSLWND